MPISSKIEITCAIIRYLMPALSARSSSDSNTIPPVDIATSSKNTNRLKISRVMTMPDNAMIAISSTAMARRPLRASMSFI